MSALAIVPPPGPETVGQRVRRLQAEARALAREQLLQLAADVAAVAEAALEVAGGGDAYPAGARDFARRLADDCQVRAATLEALTARLT